MENKNTISQFNIGDEVIWNQTEEKYIILATKEIPYKPNTSFQQCPEKGFYAIRESNIPKAGEYWSNVIPNIAGNELVLIK